ncbi:MAG: hypothetical protein M0R06_01425 [Sphaerochaeta sp.]|jgi:hypothetical protein|nr:hypothetical protein [Sphaerochaeta sp.]
MVQIPERRFEDYVVEHIEEAVGFGGVEVIGRQITLPNGILDVLAFDNECGRPLVIELKVEPLKEQDIGQVLRYTSDVADILRYRVCAKWDIPTDTRLAGFCEEVSTFTHGFGNGDLFKQYALEANESPIVPILIGTYANSKIIAAAQFPLVLLRIWHIDAHGDFVFTPPVSRDAEIDLDCYISRTWVDTLETKLEEYAVRRGGELFSDAVMIMAERCGNLEE